MTSREQSIVHWGKTLIPYSIKRTARKKTVALSVEPAGKLIVSAPLGVATSKLDSVVHSRARWVVTRLRRAAQLDAPPTKEFVSGETFLYLGRQYRLKVIQGVPHHPIPPGFPDGSLQTLPERPSPPGFPDCSLKNLPLHQRPSKFPDSSFQNEFLGEASMERGFIFISVDPFLSSPARAEQVRASLVRWYKAHALQRLQERVQLWSAKLEVPLPKVLIREQQKRWGSCSPGIVRFNWRIIQAPMRLIDYVVAHELVHLLHPDHGKAFWSRLGRILPDYEPRRITLNIIGNILIWKHKHF